MARIHRSRRGRPFVSAISALSLLAVVISSNSVSNAQDTAGITLDVQTSTHTSFTSDSITSSPFSTSQANELVVAFVTSDGPNASNAQSFTAVTGAGMDWSLRQRSSGQSGTSEIWQAVARTTLSNASVTATAAVSGFHHSMTVVSFAGADTTTNGVVAGSSAPAGAPSVSLVTTRDNSWVWATGNDWDRAAGRTPGDNQALADEYVDSSTGDTYWTQYSQNRSTSAGTTVVLDDSAPVDDRWNFAAIEILPADPGVPPATTPTASPTTTGVSASATATQPAATTATLTAGGSDKTAPSAPTNLLATTVNGSSRITLTWTASNDDVGVTGYNVYRSASLPIIPLVSNLIGTVGVTTSYATRFRSAGYFVVVARDAAGNLSMPSNTASLVPAPAPTTTATTAPAPTTAPADTTAPTTPTGVSAVSAGSTIINLTWMASSDNVAVANYQVYRDGVLIGAANSQSYSDSGLSPGSTHGYFVTAIDAAGNVSGQSAVATATTPANNVIFFDDFSGSSLGSAWTVIQRHGEYAQQETECNTAQQVDVSNSILTLHTIASPTSCGDFNVDGSVRTPPAVWPYATGDVQWKNFSFTYGSVSMRAKFPPHSSSTWPAMWLLGSNCQKTNPFTADTAYSTCPDVQTENYTEIDSPECYGGNWCQLAISQPGSFPHCDYAQETDANWHTYTLTWLPGSVSASVDGVSTGCTFTAAAGYQIPSTPMFLILQTQTGGVGGTPANLPTSFQIDSVTVTAP